jgi:hypothetical protein
MKLAPQNIWTRKNIVQAITNFQSLQKPNRTMLKKGQKKGLDKLIA